MRNICTCFRKSSPDLNWENPEGVSGLRHHRFLAPEKGVDGFRLDADQLHHQWATSLDDGSETLGALLQS
ncbi:MAG: alpha-amylase family glycosyl hydrolase [Eubacteriales bacterium]